MKQGWQNHNMKRLSLLFLLFACHAGFAQIVRGVSGNVSDTVIYTTINGEKVAATLYFDNGPNYRCYEIKEPFTEHDTNYIWRLFWLWSSDTGNRIDTCVTDYYISPRNQRDHLEHAMKISSKHFYEDGGSKDAIFIPEFLATYPNVVHHDIEDLPKMWFPIEKYRGQYYFSADNPYVIEFTDSMVLFYDQELNIYPYHNYFRETLPNGVGYYFEVEGHNGIRHTLLQPTKSVEGLYVASEYDNNNIGEKRYYLVAPLDYIDRFDLIDVARWCAIVDLEYDTVNYSALLGDKGDEVVLMIHYEHLPRYDFGKRESEIEVKLDTLECLFHVEDDQLVFPNTLIDSTEDVYMFTEEMPTFPDGSKALTTYINKVKRYPEAALENGIEGTVLVEFIVEKDGSVSHVNVKVPLFYDCDEEAVRIVKSMPKWNPAKIQGEPVRCYYQVPIVFRKE